MSTEAMVRWVYLWFPLIIFALALVLLLIWVGSGHLTAWWNTRRARRALPPARRR